ncbi:MAG: hypothetical protein AB9Q22_14165 [Candidatus Reddybacter sp.]
MPVRIWCDCAGHYAEFLVLTEGALKDVSELRTLETTYRGGIAYNPQQIIANAPSTSLTACLNVVFERWRGKG